MEYDKEKEALYCLCQMPQAPMVLEEMYQYAGSYQDIYNIEGSEFCSLGILTEKRAEKFEYVKKNRDYFTQEYHNLETKHIKFISILDKEYPGRLKEIDSKPPGFYLKGDIPEEDLPTAAIIGARSCTGYGKNIAEYIGSVLSKNNIRIISGLADGIDKAGHCGALREKKPTFGVVGCGINICYPKDNYKVFREIENCGGIISEFPLGTPPNSWNFPRRNRIISGLADVIIVVEAKKKSGSLITVGHALEQGKEVFAVPGRITDPLSEGCNYLLQTGASMLLTPEDILDFFSIKYNKKIILHEKKANGLANKEKIVYSCLDLSPKFLEEIVEECKLSLGECLSILLDLELGGYIEQTSHHYYIKKL